MTGDKLTSPLTDSLDISYHICKYYPHLLPPSLESVIRSTLSQLHQIHALPLSVPQEEYGNKIPCEAVDELLGKTDTRLEYRQALEFKKKLGVTPRYSYQYLLRSTLANYITATTRIWSMQSHWKTSAGQRLKPVSCAAP